MPKKRDDAKPGPLDGEKLRTARIAAGLTQEAVAIKAGMRQQNIVRMEKGYTPDPALSTIVAVTRAIGVTVDDVLKDVLEGDE